MPKAKPTRTGASLRQTPLEDQLRHDEAQKFAQEKKKKKQVDEGDVQMGDGGDNDGEEDVQYVPSNLSRKILSVAREQVREEEAKERKSKQGKQQQQRTVQFLEDSDNEEVEDEDEEAYANYADFEIDEADEAAMARFMSSEPKTRRTLADIIMEKLQDHQNNEANASNAQQDTHSGLEPRVVQVYESVGKLLSRYRSGKIPKAFKIIPSLKNWEEVLYITDPDGWSSQGMAAATRIFASNLNPKMAQRFYALVLLPRVRDDIASNKVLNYHLYMALKKSLYKPAAFFKGILLPLCDGGDCTLREATIIGSVLAKVSVPMVHAAAAMLKMATMPYSGATSLFLRVLMDKKYSLPYKLIDALVRHFMSFVNDQREMTVLWHQSLLVFAQRYKNTISKQQKDMLKVLLKNHHHHMITPEIRRELFA